MATTITELMSVVMKEAFIPENTKGVDTIVQFKFTGAQAANWYVVIKDQTCETTEGLNPDAKMTMTVDSEDYIKISNGELDPNMAFMKGKVKVAGDMGVALAMGKYFKMGK